MSDITNYPNIIESTGGYTPQIGNLISMMTCVRAGTLTSVKNLTLTQLDYLHDSRSNTIGALLGHIAGVEISFQICGLEARDFTDEEFEFWRPFMDLGDEGRRLITGHSIDYYLDLLSTVRATTLQEFRKRDDEWLYTAEPFWDDKPANNYFKWFHVFEDEINHRGQINWLRQRTSL